MSLNGLDVAKVVEAYEAAAAEPGGWFLLKYSSRDEVELLGNGNGGVVEVRSAVAEYEDPSPLYGFLKYRRRNVIIKYLPEGCSRLIQARVAVHFNAVCERFSPFDTQFDISVADDLRDSKLSAACSLHAATGSNSSSNSLRRKHLMEIAEEDEEEQQPTKRQSLIKDANTEEHEQQGLKGVAAATEPVKLDAGLATSPENSKFSADTTSQIPNFVGADEPLSADTNRRMSSQSGRDIYTSYSSFSTYSKPKVKIGPRPSLDTNPRPQTAGNFRPVSSIPAGFKLFGKGSNKKASSSSTFRKDSVGSAGSQASDISEMTFATTLPIPEEPGSKDLLGTMRPATSSGISTKSATTIGSRQAMTPEKARLKKAMQLREKKRKKAANVPAVPPLPSIEAPAEDGSAGDEKSTLDADKRIPIIKADSGIAIDASPKDDQASELTQSDSRPTSPVIASSEADQSTKASSISESTEQTVQKEDEIGNEDYTGANSDHDVEPPSEDSTPLAGDRTTLTGKPDGIVDSIEQTQPPTEAAIELPHPESEATVESEVFSAGEATSDNGEELAGRKPEEFTPVETNHKVQPSSEEVQESTTLDSSTAKTDIPTRALSQPDEAPKGDISETANIPAIILAESAGSVESQGAHASSTSPITHSQLTDQQGFTGEAPPALEQSAVNPSPAKVGETDADETDKTVDGLDSDNETISGRPLSTGPAAKRKGINIDPIRIDLANQSRPTSRSEINFSDSESLLEELQSATVHEAKSMFVSKTPVTPVFPGKFSAMASASPSSGQGVSVKPHIVRTVSNPVRGNLIAPPTDVSQSSARSISQGAAYLHQITQQRNADGALAKKANVGSSISQRIKALELLSVHSAENPSQAGSRPSSTFFSVKKDRAPSRSPSVADRTNSLSRDTRPSTAQSRGDSPETSRFHRDRSGSISSRLSMFEPADSPGYQPRGRPETVSVTARIIRDSPSTSRNATDRSPLELKQSPLLVDHHRGNNLEVGIGGSAEQTSHSREPSKDSVSRRSSFTIVKDFIKERRKSVSSPSADNVSAPTSTSGPRSPTLPPSAHQNNSFASRLSIGSRRSLSKDRGSISPSVVTEGSGSGDETKSNSDKKKSRTSRLMRRLSSLSGSNRNKMSSPPIGTPTVTEEEWPEPITPVVRDADSSAVVTYMGDVNVQFPDTLLWKRRNMYLDSQGFVVLSAAAQKQPSKTTGVKRYHLGEFKTPYAPDVEVQELPNSVVLDLLEGSAVQIACEDRPGQLKVLKILQDAHAAHAAKPGL